MAKNNFTESKIFTKMLLFAFPIILTNVLQTMYTIADNIIVGKFSGDTYPISRIIVIIQIVPVLAIALKKLLRADFDNVLKECEVK